jgi:hypothetical protein
MAWKKDVPLTSSGSFSGTVGVGTADAWIAVEVSR